KRLSYKFPELKIGGKTGTLSEISFPEGRCEWFTGFLELNGKKLAFSSVAVNGWTYYISGYEISAVAAEEFVKLERKKGGERCASSVR
ncbi:MAG: penicillin-binding protein, partial [Desulfurobacteriaceae bacterium]